MLAVTAILGMPDRDEAGVLAGHPCDASADRISCQSAQHRLVDGRRTTEDNNLLGLHSCELRRGCARHRGPRHEKQRVAADGTGHVVSGAYNLGFSPDPAAIDRFAKLAGRAPGVVHYYQSWGRDFQPTHANTVVTRGATPLISWEPWGGLDASGTHDAYVQSYARAVKNWNGSVYLRVGHEMNLNLFPWSDPTKFIAGWRRMVDTFRAEGATNAKFVWCPNVTYGGYFPMKEYFPGSNYVDWLCLDGYNFGTNRRSGWETFDQLFGYSINQITALAPGKPLMIGEFSSAEQGGSKADWITNAFGTAIKKYPAIRAVVWFNENYASHGQADWRLETSQSAIDAYRRAMTDPYYHGKMP